MVKKELQRKRATFLEWKIEGLPGNLMAEESDRGCLLVGLSIVDELLGKILWLHLEQMHENGKQDELIQVKLIGLFTGQVPPFGNLWMRSTMALLLGVIGRDVFNVIDRMREARNAFAHGPRPAKLTEEMVSKLFGDELEVSVAEIDDFQKFNGPNCSASKSRLMLGFMRLVMLLLAMYRHKVNPTAQHVHFPSLEP